MKVRKWLAKLRAWLKQWQGAMEIAACTLCETGLPAGGLVSATARTVMYGRVAQSALKTMSNQLIDWKASVKRKLFPQRVSAAAENVACQFFIALVVFHACQHGQERDCNGRNRTPTALFAPDDPHNANRREIDS